jgi:hypothetical protein
MNNDELLINAIKENNVSLVASLIADGSADVNAVEGVYIRRPLLGLAAKLGHVEIVTLLLDAGARIDNVDDRQNTACHAAASEGHFDVVKLLVARNANVSLRNRANETPLVISD